MGKSNVTMQVDMHKKINPKEFVESLPEIIKLNISNVMEGALAKINKELRYKENRIVDILSNLRVI